MSEETLLTTALTAWHASQGAKMVPFAGYSMPVQYADGIIKEHTHTREAAGLFDVSHMGQVRLTGEGIEEALEKLVPGDLKILKEGRIRYSVLTNDAGGIIDDLMITRRADHWYLVINASRKAEDLAHFRAHLPDTITLTCLDDRALLAIQGPKAADVMAQYDAALATMPFMSARESTLGGIAVTLSRSGYTGEDGYEISVANDDAVALADLLCENDVVKPIGLGARDTLRLEAGLCLYGNDLDETTSPVEAGLTWVINKRRKAEGGFLGSDVVLGQLDDGTQRVRVGLQPEGRVIARHDTPILNEAGESIGVVTSGGFGPTVEGPIAMGYVTPACAAEGTSVLLDIRGKQRPANIVATPFVAQRYYRAT